MGLSPHIDTHSAFEGLIFSLSLAGPCIMEFRKYNTGVWLEKPTSNSDVDNNQISEKSSNFIRKAIYLPPRSMLLLSGEARYAWHHYIPHHKVRFVNTCVYSVTSCTNYKNLCRSQLHHTLFAIAKSPDG